MPPEGASPGCRSTTVMVRGMTASLDLVGAHEIAGLLGVSRQRVHALVTARSGFPDPVAQLASGRIWQRKDIARWAAATGRELAASPVHR